ncbi:major facilitator superfamily domain-containing protein [Clohesyomyces aquaticus]|uniref:Major facilitator superfamily domain-containing protein n=1 Tax=Clohesyomyces aquaticus TaxID=1231657 RepID=A0A1Y1Y497_9PLEO|nr:major facilitator superfamily domain-containing protein [Clohesyomyces aquaticus]
MPPGPQRSTHAFPTKQLAIIAICRFSEPLAFNSILAYSYVMVKDLHGGDETNASFYSGLLVSAYAVAEAMTAMIWGAISDRYGRKPVVLIGLGGVALSSLIFGLAKHYWVALLARFVGGALNGNVAVMQNMVAEMVKNPDHEPRAYAVQPFVWTLGGIIGSAMGGFLAQPAHFYPTLFSQDGIFGRFPYLLPNLVAMVGIIMAIIQGIIFLEETNPRQSEKEDHASVFDDQSIDERTPLHFPRHRASLARGSMDTLHSHSVINRVRQIRKRASFLEESLPLPMEQSFDLRRESFGTMHSIKLPPDYRRHIVAPREEDRPRKTFNFTIIMMTLALTLVAYHQMAFVNTFPIYLLDEPDNPPGQLDLHGGLGLDLHDVGTYLAINGFIALFIQGVIFPFFVERVGIWASFVSMVVLYPTCYVIMPFISALSDSLIPVAIYVTLILQGFYGIIMVPCALILLKNATTSPLDLGKVNGLAMSASCLARTVSPPLVGMIYSEGGSGIAWLSCGLAALAGAVQLFWIPNSHVGEVHVESVLKKLQEHDDVESIAEEAIEEY